MKNLRIIIPFILNTNAYAGAVLLITLLVIFSKTIEKAEGFVAVVIIICVLMVLNGVANILLEEKVGYSNVYQVKDKEKILGVSNNNGTNYIMLFIFLLISAIWLGVQPRIGQITYLIIILPLFATVCFVVIGMVLHMLNNSFETPSALIGYAFLFFMLGSWSKGAIANTYGEERIDSFFEKSEYTTKYYVNLFPDEDSAKNYRLPADIFVYYEEGDETSSSVKCIRIGKAYFPNGGYVSFSDDGEDEKNLRFGKKVDLTDSSGKNWYVELVDRKVK